MTDIATAFIAEVRAHRVKNWGSFEAFHDGQLHLIRYEHPYIWTWKVDGPGRWDGWMHVTPVDYAQTESTAGRKSMGLTKEQYDAAQQLAEDIWRANPFEEKLKPPAIQQVPQVYVAIAMTLAVDGWRKEPII